MVCVPAGTTGEGFCTELVYFCNKCNSCYTAEVFDKTKQTRANPIYSSNIMVIGLISYKYWMIFNYVIMGFNEILFEYQQTFNIFLNIYL